MNTSPRLRSRRGFTVAELAIVIVIVGLVLAFALPRFAGYLRYLTARSTTSRVVADLSMARTQAVREGASVSFRILGPSQYRVTVDDAAGNAVRTVKTVDVEGPQRGSVTLAAAADRVTFDSRGMRRNDVAAIRIRNGTRIDSVTISAVGRIYRAR